MMNGYGPGRMMGQGGMMGWTQGISGTAPYGYGPGGMMGRGMRGGFGFNGGQPEISAEMTVTPAVAVAAAQAYLDSNGYKLTVEEMHTEPFYGYYTLHVPQDGNGTGMLSVNGFTGQVFPHTWHGQLLEVQKFEAETH